MICLFHELLQPLKVSALNVRLLSGMLPVYYSFDLFLLHLEHSELISDYFPLLGSSLFNHLYDRLPHLIASCLH
jgi:hypothetical protein